MAMGVNREETKVPTLSSLIQDSGRRLVWSNETRQKRETR